MKHTEDMFEELTQFTQLTRVHRGLEHWNRGTNYLKSEQFDLAIEEFTKVIQTNAIPSHPDLAMAYYYRALLYIRQESYGMAIKDLTEYIRFQPNKAQGYQARAKANYSMAKYDLAIEDWSRAIEIEPDADTYLSRGLAYHRLQKLDFAVRDYTKAINANPDELEAFRFRGQALYEASVKCSKMSDRTSYLDRAESDFRRYLQMNPSSPQAYEVEEAMRGINRIRDTIKKLRW